MTNHTNLPESAQRLVDLIGYEAALKVIDAWGGIRKHVPTEKRLTQDSEIVHLIGFEKARLFCREFSGPCLRLPTCKEALGVAMYQADHSAATVARTLRVNESTVWKWIKRDHAQRTNDGTLDIFEEWLI